MEEHARILLQLGVLVALMGVAHSGLYLAPPDKPAKVCEDVKIAMQYLGRQLHMQADKLERHESRERQLGEQLKKALNTLDKKQRAADTSLGDMSSTLTRLEDRMRTAESSMLQRDERERIQLQKITDSVEGMVKSMNDWQTKMEGVMDNRNNVETVDSAVVARLDQVAQAVGNVERLLGGAKPLSSEIENLRITSANLVNANSNWRQYVEKVEHVLRRFDSRLLELVATTAPPVSTGVDDWHAIFLTALESHQEILKDLKQLGESAARNIADLPSREEVATLSNSTTEKLDEVRYELITGTDKAVSQLDRTINGAQTTLGRGQDDILRAISDNGVSVEENVRTGYDQLLKEVKDLSSVEKVLIQTADNVLDTKRRIEYGVHQILIEVEKIVKLQAKDLNATVNRRFDHISTTILDNQTGALTNLSSKIETEISQVWRQIGIMYQQVSASNGALDKLQKQTEMYVNGSILTMDSMEGKVTEITARMNEFDGNLHNLLGRLSLFTQEFNLVKNGLGEALDNIRNSFRKVQDEIKDMGRGPNPIAENSTPGVFPFEAESR